MTVKAIPISKGGNQTMKKPAASLPEIIRKFRFEGIDELFGAEDDRSANTHSLSSAISAFKAKSTPPVDAWDTETLSPQIGESNNVRSMRVGAKGSMNLREAYTCCGYARAAAVFWHRGFEEEALKAVRLAHVRDLIGAVQMVLQDLGSPDGEWLDLPDMTIEHLLREIRKSPATDGSPGILPQYLHLAEYALEIALANVRTSANGVQGRLHND